MKNNLRNWKNKSVCFACIGWCLLQASFALGAGGGAAASGPYIELSPAFVVNYGGGGKMKYLKADISLRVDDPKAVEAVNHHMPLIRNALVLLFSRQTEAAVASVEGKEAMRQESLAEINRLLMEEAGEGIAVKDVLFNNLVTQR